ncbi:MULTISPECIES: FAD-dependent oxidoreductase [unclassified Bosea (in: a-proteobacteria)]|uniref:NAD(P)/FAD-dependent oxidoreductase n=1 Tax=unclassified Bosea (in: a-proteobacteria) TaxID=2653178 RepID=UPI000F76505D|nr:MULTISPECIES: FAD-dependent oxidoreductase [unclassified Bosea (in: a-proteobacteria)]AZO79325.1 FAD-dependent oxidoreductase [Bosea sp. Tri-49]RXT27263.1 FAD-dependent oxidoreductase [Bosea sp. Tri-39]RXT36031.1 FAD-dependent oxidoreductase [Bosea sp. Tri-54]
MRVDVIIVGGGIAGASAAYFLSRHGSVALIEREEQAGYHSSGRSAAQFTVGITAPTMRRMAQASRVFLEAPPAGFCIQPIMTPRGCLTVAAASQEAALDRLEERILSVGARTERLDGRASLDLFPALRPEKVHGGVYEPDAMDIDVDVLLQGYLRGARANGATIVLKAGVDTIRRDATGWTVAWPGGDLQAPLLVNAAGAWADEIAGMAGVAPLGIVPKRRTAFTFAHQPDHDSRGWPHVSNVDYRWYVKPESGCLMGSLADATPTTPGDAYADDLDVAQAIENIEQDTSFRIGRPLSQWAGLRSFVADAEPVAGARPDEPGFFWLVGQGGCGILTSPAMGEVTAALLAGRALPAAMTELGVTAADLSPTRSSLERSG